MEQNFSVKVFAKYALRLWLIALVAAVLGGIGYGIYSKLSAEDMPMARFEGNIKIASIDKFGVGGDKEQELAYYKITCERAISIMTNEVLKAQVYSDVKKNFPDEKKFYDGFKVTSSANFLVKAIFSYGFDSDKRKVDIEQVVIKFCEKAVAAVEMDNVVMQDKTEVSYFESTNNAFINSEGGKAIINIALGAIGGLAVGLIIIAIIFFADKHLKSIRSVACWNRFLGVNKETVAKDTVINTDTALTEVNAKVAAIFNIGENNNNAFAEKCAEYSREVGRKTILLDFCPRENYDGLSIEEFLDGKDIDVGSDILCAKKQGEWQKLIFRQDRLKDLATKYDRVIMNLLPDNGAVGVIGLVADTLIANVHQPSADVREILSLAVGADNDEKLCGIVVNNPLRSFVDVKAK